MQEKREAFELCTQQAVLIGLQQHGVGEKLSGIADNGNVNNIYNFTRATTTLTECIHTVTDTHIYT